MLPRDAVTATGDIRLRCRVKSPPVRYRSCLAAPTESATPTLQGQSATSFRTVDLQLTTVPTPSSGSFRVGGNVICTQFVPPDCRRSRRHCCPGGAPAAESQRDCVTGFGEVPLSFLCQHDAVAMPHLRCNAVHAIVR